MLKMNRLYIMLLLCIFAGSNLLSQNTNRKGERYRALKDSTRILNDSLRMLQDSLTRIETRQKPDTGSVNPIKETAQRLIGSMFGESRQLSNADSLIREFDRMPSFGIYRDNYFIVGSEIFKKSDEYNSDAKFQVSIRQRLTNSTLPFKTHLYLTYTQKAFWDVFRESFPFRDLNFNPGIGIGRPLVHNNRFMGMLSFEFEHESNGKDGDASRSWNKITLGSLLTFNDNWALQAKAWVPIVDGENNKHITSYSGLGLIALSYMSPKSKYNASFVFTKRAGAFFDGNVLINFSVRLFSDDNQYLFLEYYNGYGESMLQFDQYRQRVRLGIVIRPNFFSIY